MKYLNYFCYILIYLFLSSSPACASYTAEENWSIEIDNIDINSGLPTPTTRPKQPIKDNPTETIYLDTNSINHFSLNISNLIIDYGIISPTNSIYRTNNISIYGNITNSIVNAYHNHPLAIPASNTNIPDTSCDNGSCTQVTAAPWENTLTYGFGYRCQNIKGNGCPVDFKTPNYYKQFSDDSKNELPAIIMSNFTNDVLQETQIIYKVNISKTQPEGSYTNTIIYIASPGY